MSMIRYIHIAFEIWSAVFCCITAFCVFTTQRYDRRGARYLIALLLSNAILNFSESLAYYYRGNITSTGFYMVRITNFTVFVCNHILSLFAIYYITRVIEKNGGGKNEGYKKASTIIISIGILILVLSRIFGFLYSFDEQNRYYRTESYWIMLVPSSAVLVLLILVTFSNKEHFKPLEKISFLMFEFLPLIGIVIQFFTYGISVANIANTISILLIFLTYEMEYSNYMIQKERKLLDQMIVAFSQTIDAKDSYTGGHSSRVAQYSRMISERLGLDDKQIQMIYQMALLHDVGKIGIADYILRKDSKLSEDEYHIIQLHPVKGNEILENITEMPMLSVGAHWHHERFDGKGYPDGLKGYDIPLEARIICVADSYDAMTSNRSYRHYLPQEAVRREIEKNSGTQFDPEIAKCMLDIIDNDHDYILHE